jgi:hypothetical protein
MTGSTHHSSLRVAAADIGEEIIAEAGEGIGRKWNVLGLK